MALEDIDCPNYYIHSYERRLERLFTHAKNPIEHRTLAKCKLVPTAKGISRCSLSDYKDCNIRAVIKG